MPLGQMDIVIGGQAGSESKGKLSAHLVDRWLRIGAKPLSPPILGLSMASSPNAGHTVVLPDGTKKVSYHIPACAVMDSELPIFLGPSSLVNIGKLNAELDAMGVDPKRVIIHPRATIIWDSDVDRETRSGLSDIGSTLQGVGSARVKKMQRDGSADFMGEKVAQSMTKCVVGDTVKAINNLIRCGGRVLHEMTQGFDLDLEHGMDGRYCTSKMVNPSMGAAEAGVAPCMVGDVYGVIRPFPIRVSNRTGTSGPYPGAEEITWDDVAEGCGYDAKHDGPLREITTTTKLPRRVFTFSWERYRHFLMVCRPDSLCLQFANYLDWNVYEATDEGDLTGPVRKFIGRLNGEAHDILGYGGIVDFVGTGPRHDHMINVNNDYTSLNRD